MAERGRRGCLGVPLQWCLPGLYLALAVYTWFEFTRTNPDGLANVGLFVVTLPVTLIFLAVGAAAGRSSMWLPQGHGYIGDHLLYYVPAVIFTSLIVWLIGRAIDRLLSRK